VRWTLNQTSLHQRKTMQYKLATHKPVSVVAVQQGVAAERLDQVDFGIQVQQKGFSDLWKKSLPAAR
jgi:hypothetical protein